MVTPFIRSAFLTLCVILSVTKISAQIAGSNPRGDYIPFGKVTAASSLAKRAASTVQYPMAGTYTGLVILIDFPDQTADISVSEVNSFLNAATYTNYGDNGSIGGYYRYISQGRLNLTLLTTPTYYRAKNPYWYYDSLGHTGDLLLEALSWVDTLKSIDISKATRNADGSIKSLNFFYARNVHSVGAHGLWGHSSGYGYSFKNYPGISTGAYCLAELGEKLRLGGLCHEMGHQLCGFPDLYDTQGKSNGCGRYCLMAFGNSDPWDGGGSRNPIPVNPYFRYLRGWNEMTDLYGTAAGSTVTLTTDTLNTFCYRNPDRPGEMFIIEARDTLGHYNNTPGQGVLIWHIDSAIHPDMSGGNDLETRPQRTAQSHYVVSVEQADGKFDLENNNYYGHDADFFKKGGSLDHFTSSTTPINAWWDGSASGFEVNNISALGKTMTFTLGSSNSYLLHASSTLGGKALPQGSFWVAAGGSKTFTVSLTKGFTVDSCLVNNKFAGAAASYTFSNVMERGDLSFIVSRMGDNLTGATQSLQYRTYAGNDGLFGGDIPLFDTMQSAANGTVTALTLDKRPKDQYFGMRFTGWIKVPAAGLWSFGLSSDDGSRLSIGGLTIANYDGQHGAGDTIRGAIRLRAGYHPYVLDYINGQAGFDLKMFIGGPGIAWRMVTPADFYLGTVATGPDLAAAVDPSKQRLLIRGNILLVKGISARSVVEVVALNGRRLIAHPIADKEESAAISLAGLAKGTYLCRVKFHGGGTVERKFVKTAGW
jgi:M6 family metalloprotease-like protein